MLNKILPRIPIQDLIERELPLLNSPFGFDYIRAKNGMFKRSENHFYRVVMPIRTDVKYSGDGLHSLTPDFSLKVSKISSTVLERGLGISQRLGLRKKGPLEAMFFVHRFTEVDAERDVLTFPRDVDLTSVSVSCPAPDPKSLIMEFHSHHEMSAYFSGTDDGDEVEFRIYGVLGSILSRPTARFRVGLYGHFMDVRLEQVFSGDLSFIEDGVLAVCGKMSS